MSSTSSGEAEQSVLFARLLRYHRDPAFIVSLPAGVVLEANQAAIEVLHEERVHLNSSRLVDHLTSAHRGSLEGRLSALAGGDVHPLPLTAELSARTGATIAAELTLFRVIEAQLPCALVIARDLSTLRCLESLLESIEYHFKNLAELASDGTSSLRVLPDGTFELEWITEQFSRVLGLPLVRLNSFESWLPIIHPDDIQAVVEAVPRALRGETVQLEIRLVSQNGDVHYTECAVLPVIDPETGKVVRLLSTMHDITRSKLAEEELRHSHEFTRRILNAIGDPIFVKNDQRRWIELNDSLCSLMGQSREALIGKSDYDVFPREQADVFWSRDRMVLGTGVTDINEEQITWQGSVHTISTKKSLLVDPSTGARYIVGIIRDITDRARMESEIRLHKDHLEELVEQRTAELKLAYQERRKASMELEKKHAELLEANEELKRLHRMKDEFTAMVSHELRTPLVTGLGYLEMLLTGRMGSVSDEVRSKMNVARRNLRRLSSLIDDLLNFYRLSRKEQAYVPCVSRLDLSALFRECVDDFTIRMERSESSVSIEVDPGTPMVMADESMIRRVIANLLDNVARHAGEGASVRLVARSGSEGWVPIRVIDDGVGIPDHLGPTLFDPFVSSSKLGRGAGLGLAIVRIILQAHGSPVSIDSEPGKGTTVSFSLQAVQD